MEIKDKVIYTDTNGTDWDAELRDLPDTQINAEDMAVISMGGGWPIWVPRNRVREPLDRTEIARRIVARYNNLIKLRTAIDEEYAAIQQLMREDGQPDHELDRVADYRTTQRNVLRYETRSDLGNWEGYHSARLRH